jgi:hypothetical protein
VTLVSRAREGEGFAPGFETKTMAVAGGGLVGISFELTSEYHGENNGLSLSDY